MTAQAAETSAPPRARHRRIMTAALKRWRRPSPDARCTPTATQGPTPPAPPCPTPQQAPLSRSRSRARSRHPRVGNSHNHNWGIPVIVDMVRRVQRGTPEMLSSAEVCQSRPVCSSLRREPRWLPPQGAWGFVNGAVSSGRAWRFASAVAFGSMPRPRSPTPSSLIALGVSGPTVAPIASSSLLPHGVVLFPLQAGCLREQQRVDVAAGARSGSLVYCSRGRSGRVFEAILSAVEIRPTM